MSEDYTLTLKDQELHIQWRCEAEDRIYFCSVVGGAPLVINRIAYTYSGDWTPYDGVRVELRRKDQGWKYKTSQTVYRKARELFMPLGDHFRQRLAAGAYAAHIQAAVQRSIEAIEKQMAVLTELRQSLKEVGERADEVSVSQRELEILGGVYFHDPLYRVQDTADKVLGKPQE